LVGNNLTTIDVTPLKNCTNLEFFSYTSGEKTPVLIWNSPSQPPPYSLPSALRRIREKNEFVLYSDYIHSSNRQQIQRLERFKNALRSSFSVPFSVACTHLNFSSDAELVSWLWSLDIDGLLINYETFQISLSASSNEVYDEIDKLLESYSKMDKNGHGKVE
jgi:hypothetical protein